MILRYTSLASRQEAKKGDSKIIKKKGKYTDAWDAIWTAGTLGLHMVTATFVGLAMGYYLDKWLGTKPWFLLIMLVMGIISGFRMVIEDTRRIQRADKKDDQEKDAEED